MAEPPAASPPPRKPRADAERNRQRLLHAARAVFAEKGSDASLEEIARGAGVGIGTLYRHFPTRDALISDLYSSASEALAAAADRLAAEQPPAEALRRWLLLFVDAMSDKLLIVEALRALPGGPDALFAASGQRTERAIALLAERAEASGTLRLDMQPMDLLRAVYGLVSTGPGWEPRARRLVDVLIAGMQAQESAPNR